MVSHETENYILQYFLDGICGSLSVSLVSQRQGDQKKITAMVRDNLFNLNNLVFYVHS